jgi:hypothetical protein
MLFTTGIRPTAGHNKQTLMEIVFKDANLKILHDPEIPQGEKPARKTLYGQTVSYEYDEYSNGVIPENRKSFIR